MNRGVAIVTYNRADVLEEVIASILNTVPHNTKVVVCDDGSTDKTIDVVKKFNGIPIISGPNVGVAGNKNRALWALQDCQFSTIIEDDLIAMKPGWFDAYESACMQSGIHHFCRVQDKLIPESIPEFSDYMKTKNLTPIYGPSPRGDLTFISIAVIRAVGGFNPAFIGAGYAHGEWSNRVANAGLIGHPNKWVDILEASECFIQKGDREGGRWMRPEEEIKTELKRNKLVLKELKKKPTYTYHPLMLV